MTVQTMDSITTEATEPTDTSTTEQSAAQEQSTEQQADQVEQHEAEQEGKEPPPKAEKKGVQGRIDELTRARYEAEREAKFWRDQAAKGTPGNTSSQDAPAKPVKADFASDDEFFEALADFKAEQKVQQFRQQNQAERAQEADAKQTASQFDLYRARVAESAEAMPDYEQVVGQSDVPAAPHVLESILDSDIGPQLAYHLAKNPDVAERLNTLSPTQAAREIGRLEAQIAQPKASTPPQKRTTQAPPPITPVRGGSGQFTKAPEAMSDSEWFASRKR